MRTRFKNILIGSIAAIMCASIIIYSIESHRSLYQITAGFLLFVLPFAFLPSFFSKTGSFIFVFITIMIGFIVSKFYYNDFWLGVLLSAIIGGAIYIFLTIPAIKTMNDFKPFSPNDYKDKAKQFHDKK